MKQNTVKLDNEQILYGLNPKLNGALYLDYGDGGPQFYIGRVDTTGDVYLEDGCPFEEREIVEQVMTQMTGRHPDAEPEWYEHPEADRYRLMASKHGMSPT